VESRAEIALDPSALDRLKARLADAQLGPRLGDGWEHGVSHAWLTELLADPASHGADSDEAFVVVTPSLPGFGFSDTPSSALSSRETAGLWRRMMDALGAVTTGRDVTASRARWSLSSVVPLARSRR
jgi:hypothetical protein